MDIKDIFNKYIEERIVSLRSLEEGHINDTFLVETKSGKYVLQLLNERMDVEKLLYNYKLYSKAFDEYGMLYPKWIEINDNKSAVYINEKNSRGNTEDEVNIKQAPKCYFFEDPEGQIWRLYTYIEGDTVKSNIDEDEAFALGEGLARLHDIMLTIKTEPKAVYPHLHDLERYYKFYRDCLHNEELCKQENRSGRIEREIEERIKPFLDNNYVNFQTVHGDPKLSNAIFRNGKVVGFIDMDTIMTGSIEEDLADCIRSCCIHDGSYNHKLAKKIIEGYESVCFNDKNLDFKTAFEKRVDFSFEKICFELGLRYYTDAISNEHYFKGKSSEYLIKRAKELLFL